MIEDRIRRAPPPAVEFPSEDDEAVPVADRGGWAALWPLLLVLLAAAVLLR